MDNDNEKKTPPASIPESNGKRSRSLIGLTLAIILLALSWAIYWLLVLQYYESTDDAYANGNKVFINASISGSITAFYADDTSFVSEGQLLVSLDETKYRLDYEKELAYLADVVLQVRQIFDHVAVAKAQVDFKRAALSKAQYDYDNRSRLVDSKAVSNEDFTHSKDTLKGADADYQQAKAQLQAALAAAGNTDLIDHPSIVKQKATIRSAYYQLKHCSIYAPCNGYVAQRVAEVGKWVVPTTNLMSIIPTDYVWVDANFKETQLAYMRVGQPATVWFDIYGSGRKFKGKVLGIASGTGSVFSIIPPQNATGNWIKIVQRLPVRIGLDVQDLRNYPLRLGLSAEVSIDITDQQLPFLAGKAPEHPIAETNVYSIDFAPVEKAMDEIISANLKQ